MPPRGKPGFSAGLVVAAMRELASFDRLSIELKDHKARSGHAGKVVLVGASGSKVIDCIQLPYGFAVSANMSKHDCDPDAKVSAVLNIVYDNDKDAHSAKLLDVLQRLSSATTEDSLIGDGLPAGKVKMILAGLRALPEALLRPAAGYVNARQSTCWFPAQGLEGGTEQFSFQATSDRGGVTAPSPAVSRESRLLQYTQDGFVVRGEPGFALLSLAVTVLLLTPMCIRCDFRGGAREFVACLQWS
jgi:hypothetical protein